LTRKFSTNKNAIAPKTVDMPQVLVHPYKLNNFRNEYTKDISNLFCDPCLSPEYERLYNIKDKKYRGNQFGVRYFPTEIFNRDKYNFSYSNERLHRQYPEIVKNDPWFKSNWSAASGNIGPLDESDNITNNKENVNDNDYLSHPYYYYRSVQKETCRDPITEMPNFLERFTNKTNDWVWVLYLIMPLILIAIAKGAYIKR